MSIEDKYNTCYHVSLYLPPATAGAACLRFAACLLIRLKIVAKTMTAPRPINGLIACPKITVLNTIENICRVVMMIVKTMGPNVLIV